VELCPQCAGVCFDSYHRLAPVCDDLLPVFPESPGISRRVRVAGNVVVIAGGIALAGGAAYGVVPGELGHNGARLVNVAPPRAQSPAQVLANSYLPATKPAKGSVGTPLGEGPNPNVVYVDGTTPSYGPSIVSVEFPNAVETVLATRGEDGHCTYMRGNGKQAETATSAVGSVCKAASPPAQGWKPFFASRYGSGK
jgi:hypothetical protein